MSLQVPTCTTCQTTFDIGKRTSQERIDDAAVKAGWWMGLPNGAMYCLRCTRVRWDK